MNDHSIPHLLSQKPPIKVIVVGSSCTGKTTFAKRLSKVTGIPHIELDALHWRENWEAVPVEEFRELVDFTTNADRWIVDGNYYKKLKDILWNKATHVIWLDYSALTVLGRAFRRTLTRVFTKEELYSGNRESFRKAFLSKDSIILWVITTYWKKKKRYLKMFAGKEYPNVEKIRIQSSNDAERFFASIR